MWEPCPPSVAMASLLVTGREGKEESHSNYPPLPASYVNGCFLLKQAIYMQSLFWWISSLFIVNVSLYHCDEGRGLLVRHHIALYECDIETYKNELQGFGMRYTRSVVESVFTPPLKLSAAVSSIPSAHQSSKICCRYKKLDRFVLDWHLFTQFLWIGYFSGNKPDKRFKNEKEMWNTSLVPIFFVVCVFLNVIPSIVLRMCYK